MRQMGGDELKNIIPGRQLSDGVRFFFLFFFPILFILIFQLSPSLQVINFYIAHIMETYTTHTAHICSTYFFPNLERNYTTKKFEKIGNVRVRLCDVKILTHCSLSQKNCLNTSVLSCQYILLGTGIW